MARILVIDDNQDMRELVQVILETAGYQVDLASDGVTGIAAQRKAPFDLVITDIFMPEQDGIETIVQLLAEFPNLQVIALSGGGHLNRSLGYLRTAMEIGAHAILSKPFEREHLLGAVRDLLSSRS